MRLPAPVGGINRRDPAQVAGQGFLRSQDARRLVNIFPHSDRAEIRKGYAEYVDIATLGGFSGDKVKTLAELIRGATKYFVAATEGGMVDITTSSTSVLTAAGTHSNDRWYHTTFADDSSPNSPELLLVNGEDAPQKFDGTTMSNWTFFDDNSGSPVAFSSISDFVGVTTFKNRVYMWQKDSRDFWFGRLSKIPGSTSSDALIRFPLSAIQGAQGNITAIHSWTRDGGNGPDDYFVVVTDLGSVIVYEGSDPSSSDGWVIVGVYKISPPIDSRAVQKFVDDIAIVTEDDVYFLSEVLRTQGVQISRSAFAPLVAELALNYKTNEGWQLKIWRDRAFINVPTADTESSQLVINTATLAACQYEGIHAQCWESFKNAIYFGGVDGKVYIAESGADDDGASISFEWVTGAVTPPRMALKTIQAVRPLIKSSEKITLSIDTVPNLQVPSLTPVTSEGDSTGWIWDTSPSSGPTWDEITWTSINSTDDYYDWEFVGCQGEYVTIGIAGRVNDIAGAFYGLDLQVETTASI